MFSALMNQFANFRIFFITRRFLMTLKQLSAIERASIIYIASMLFVELIEVGEDDVTDVFENPEGQSSLVISLMYKFLYFKRKQSISQLKAISRQSFYRDINETDGMQYQEMSILAITILLVFVGRYLNPYAWGLTIKIKQELKQSLPMLDDAYDSIRTTFQLMKSLTDPPPERIFTNARKFAEALPEMF